MSTRIVEVVEEKKPIPLLKPKNDTIEDVLADLKFRADLPLERVGKHSEVLLHFHDRILDIITGKA